MLNYRFSGKFYIGVVLILLSLIIGGVTKITLILYLASPEKVTWNSFLVSLIIYIISWPMLLWGIWWTGRETYEALKRYFSYRYYHHSIKEGTKRAYHHTKILKEKVKGRLRRKKNIEAVAPVPEQK